MPSWRKAGEARELVRSNTVRVNAIQDTKATSARKTQMASNCWTVRSGRPVVLARRHLLSRAAREWRALRPPPGRRARRWTLEAFRSPSNQSFDTAR